MRRRSTRRGRSCDPATRDSAESDALRTRHSPSGDAARSRLRLACVFIEAPGLPCLRFGYICPLKRAGSCAGSATDSSRTFRGHLPAPTRHHARSETTSPLVTRIFPATDTSENSWSKLPRTSTSPFGDASLRGGTLFPFIPLSIIDRFRLRAGRGQLPLRPLSMNRSTVPREVALRLISKVFPYVLSVESSHRSLVSLRLTFGSLPRGRLVSLVARDVLRGLCLGWLVSRLACVAVRPVSRCRVAPEGYRRKDRPEHETSPQGACFPSEAMEGGSEENPKPKLSQGGERGVPEGEVLVRGQRYPLVVSP